MLLLRTQVVIISVLDVDSHGPALVVAQDTEDAVLFGTLIPVDTCKMIEVPLEGGVLVSTSREIKSRPSLQGGIVRC